MLRRKVLDNGPLVTPEQYTLLDYVQWVDDLDPHWRNGITYPAIACGGGVSSTYDLCVTSAPPVTGANPTKSDNSGRDWRGATPFTLFTEIDCSPVGWAQDSERITREALLRWEHIAVEEVFTTGVVTGQSDIMYPHLSANTVVLDPTDSLITLQPAATTVVTGTFDVVEGLGLLEQAIADCYGARGVIHVTLPVFDEMVNELIVFLRNGQWVTAKGNLVVPGSGYTGQAPDGTAAPAGTSWMYATGAIMGYRSEPKQVASIPQSFVRTVNTLKIIIERTYVIGFDCCLNAIRVSTGGTVTGTANSAT